MISPLVSNFPEKGNLVNSSKKREDIESLGKRDLRYVLTQNCNYDCWFCHKESMDGNELELFNVSDYSYLYDVAKSAIPLAGVTLTGGEPLLRKDFGAITDSLKNKGAFLTTVTNGSLIDKKLDEIGGLDRLNVSLHTTQQDLYRNITGIKVPVEKVMNHIRLLKAKYPKLDLRINSALVKGSTADEKDICKLLDFVKENQITLKYLQLGPKSDPLFVPNSFVIPFLEKKGFSLELPNGFSKDKSTYVCDGAKVILRKCSCDFVEDNGLDQNYCKINNDITVSPDGKISSCIADTKKFDLYDLVKKRDSEKIRAVFEKFISFSINYACCL